MVKKLINDTDPKHIYKILMKVKQQIDSIGFNFAIDVKPSLFLFKKDKELIIKINRKMTELNLDIAELMYSLREELNKDMVKVKLDYPCNSCELKGNIECPLDQGCKCFKLENYKKKK